MTLSLREWADCPAPGVVFDFNGTLSRDEPILLRIYTELFERHLGWRMPSELYFARFAGRSDREIVEIAVEDLAGGDEALVARLLDERRRRYHDLIEEDSPITEDTRQLVSRLAARGVPLGIVTGAQRPDVEFVLARPGLVGHFRVIVTEEDVRHGKPHPEGFLLAANRLGLVPRHILAFEDSVYGVQAAKAAGMACVAVEGATAPELLRRHADAVITALTPDLLDDGLGIVLGPPAINGGAGASR